LDLVFVRISGIKLKLSDPKHLIMLLNVFVNL